MARQDADEGIKRESGIVRVFDKRWLIAPALGLIASAVFFWNHKNRERAVQEPTETSLRDPNV